MFSVPMKQEHVDCGKRKGINSCPVALALRAAYPSAKWVIVGLLGSAWISVGGVEFKLSLGESTQRFIRSFDGSDTITEQPRPTPVVVESVSVQSDFSPKGE